MAGKKDDGKTNGDPAHLILPLTIVTMIGGGGGAFLGASILPQFFQAAHAPETSEPEPSSPSSSKNHGHEGADGTTPDPKGRASAALEVKQLPPIVANLLGDGKPLIRLQSAFLYDPKELPHADALIASLRADIVSFLGTLELSAIEGPDGLRRLQEELSERAATRSEGRIREFIIETLVIQ